MRNLREISRSGENSWTQRKGLWRKEMKTRKTSKKNEARDWVDYREKTKQNKQERESRQPRCWLKAMTRGGMETTAPRIPCGASLLCVSLLGNLGKQDGYLRERSPVVEAFFSPGIREQFTQWSRVGTVALRKRSLVFFSHGAET